MMGGLQFRALHAELVGSGRMTDRAFHDAVLESGTMPVEMVRALLTRQPLTPGHTAQWKFAGPLQGSRCKVVKVGSSMIGSSKTNEEALSLRVGATGGVRPQADVERSPEPDIQSGQSRHSGN
jgi:hypothetical protein